MPQFVIEREMPGALENSARMISKPHPKFLQRPSRAGPGNSVGA
jgi:hypothetical protein